MKRIVRKIRTDQVAVRYLILDENYKYNIVDTKIFILSTRSETARKKAVAEYLGVEKTDILQTEVLTTQETFYAMDLDKFIASAKKINHEKEM